MLGVEQKRGMRCRRQVASGRIRGQDSHCAIGPDFTTQSHPPLLLPILIFTLSHPSALPPPPSSSPPPPPLPPPPPVVPGLIFGAVPGLMFTYRWPSSIAVPSAVRAPAPWQDMRFFFSLAIADDWARDMASVARSWGIPVAFRFAQLQNSREHPTR